MAELRPISGRGLGRPGPAAVDPAALAVARGALLRALGGTEGAAVPGLRFPPEDRRAAFRVQLGAGGPGLEGRPAEAAILALGRAAYRLAAGARMVIEGLEQPVDLLV